MRYFDILRNYEAKDSGNLTSVLNDFQSKFEYIPSNAISEISEHLDLSVSTIYSEISHSHKFSLRPPGENLIKICRGSCCHIKQSLTLLRNLKNLLGINESETTEDKRFTLETVACINACSLSPVININDDYYYKVELDEIPAILDKYKKKKVKIA